MSFNENTIGMSDSAIVVEMLEQWQEAQQLGRPVTPEDLCRSFPHLLAELKRQIDALDPLSIARGGETHPPSMGESLQSTSSLASLCFHAKGGLGAVYRATETELNRQVAVKFIHHNLIKDRDSRDRFQLEAEVTGRLEHPGIVPLYGIGQTDTGRLFYYMRYIDGETMDEAIQRYHLSRTTVGAASEQGVEFRRLLTSFISVCKTVAYAHNRGIVHRDIKPANVMLGRYGETIVVDWGLAVPVNRDDRFRNSGEMTLMPTSGSQTSTSGGGAGTLAYMSPEQASNLAPTPASDVYSLGATLYKILCGQPAFTGDNTHEIRTQVIEGRFAKPSTIARTIPRNLEAICLKGMQARPTDRYQTALDMAHDVENYLADEPVSVLTETVPQQVARWVRHHRFAAQSAAVGVAGIVLVSVLAAVWLGTLAKKESEARELADQSHSIAEEARRQNLETTARTMAKTVGYEIDLRWRLLESEAQSDQLKRLLTTANANPVDKSLWEPIQAWLNEHRGLKGNAIQNSNWSIFSNTGLQYARTPKGTSIGSEYRHREYFHGLGRDLEKDDPQVATLQPLQFLLPKLAEQGDVVNLSCVYQSTATNKLVVSFSVPVWSNEDPVNRQILGLLAMTLEIDDFGVQKNAMLFQIAPSGITKQPGMVIAHPKLKTRKSDAEFPRVSSEVLQRAESMIEEDTDQAVQIIPNFVDPLSGEQHLAAMSPVIVRSRTKEVADIGWILLVTEAN
jgi:tRNA A-37 threonylcarbamoyl transferase component Bud32